MKNKKSKPSNVPQYPPVSRFRQNLASCAELFGRVPGWAWLLAFAAAWLALRLPWLASDGGVPAFWEYGYFVTDEGYYLGGGKEKFVFGQFVNLTRSEAFTFGFSPLTHFLSWLGYLAFGLSNWAWRVPFVIVNFSAWMALFRWCAARSSAATAFLLCLAVSSSPLVLVYERTASNDVLIGSLLVLSFCLACSRRVWVMALSAAIFALVVGVKPSFYALLPIVLAGVLSQKKTKWHWLDAVVFCAFVAIGIVCVKSGARLLVTPDATAQGVTPAEIIRRTSQYNFPDLWNFTNHFKGLASFPRHPGGLLLGPLALFIVPFPLAMFVARLSDFKRQPYLDWRVLLYAAVPAYVGAITVIPTSYSHYYLPAIALIPALCVAAWDDCRKFESIANRRGGVLLAAVACVIAFMVVRFASYDGIPVKIAPFFSMQYNFPQELPWIYNWKSCVLFAALGGAAICAVGWRGRVWWWRSVAVFISMLALASVVWSQAPSAALAPHIKMNANEFIMNMALCASAGLALLFVVFAFPRHSAAWKAAPLLLVCLFYAANPRWQAAAVELLRKGGDLQAKAAAELAPLLPPGAIVISERSNQMLMSLPVRTATAFASNSNHIPVIKRILEKEPDVELFTLIDPQHSYCIQYYEQNKDWVTLRPMKQVMLPSFGDGKPVPVTLCRIVVKR